MNMKERYQDFKADDTALNDGGQNHHKLMAILLIISIYKVKLLSSFMLFNASEY